jgi:hypothetical protein
VAVAQGAPGRIVQASDGTLYLLKDGVRYAIVGEPVEDDELSAYAEGDAIGAGLLLNGLAAPAPAPTAPETAVVAPPPAAPPASEPADKTSATGTRVRNPEPPTQPAALQFGSVQGSPGGTGAVTVRAEPGQSCTLVFSAAGPRRAAGSTIGQQTVGSNGTAAWSFPIDPAGGTVAVTCGAVTINSPIGTGLTR